MNKTLPILTALFTWLCAPSALAHSLHVFAQYDGRTVSGKAYYSDMTPAAETYMEILQAGQDSPLLEGKTDRDGQFAYPINTMVIRKEVTVCGSLRAYQEFPLAARLVESGRLDLSPLITASYPLEKAEEAILAASDKTRSMKVVLTGPAL